MFSLWIQHWIALDYAIFWHTNQDHFSEWADILAVYFCWEVLWTLGAGLLVTLAWWRRDFARLKVILLLVGVVVGTDILCARVLKPYFQRERPCVNDTRIRTPAGCGGLYSFPSNHAANGMALFVCILGLGYGKGAILAFLVALLMGYARIYLGVHYPSDILGGYGIGAITGGIGLWIWYWLHSRKSFSVRKAPDAAGGPG